MTKEKKEVKQRRRGRLVHKLDYVPDAGQVFVGQSVTVPDESYSIRELVDKFVRGQRMDVRSHEGTYDEGASFDGEDLEKLKVMDLHEREMYIEDLKEAVELTKKKIDTAQKLRRDEIIKEEQELKELRMKYRKEAKAQSGGQDKEGNDAASEA